MNNHRAAKIICAIALILKSISLFVNAQIVNPLHDYAEASNSERDVYSLHPKEVLKVHMNLAGDGKQELFFTAPGYSDKMDGYYWTVYIPIDHGYKKVTTTMNGDLIGFHSDFYVGMIDEIGQIGIVTYRKGSKGEGDLYAYWLKSGQILGKTIGTVVFKEANVIPPLFQRYFPNAGKSNAPPPIEIQHISADTIRSSGYHFWGDK